MRRQRPAAGRARAAAGGVRGGRVIDYTDGRQSAGDGFIRIEQSRGRGRLSGIRGAGRPGKGSGLVRPRNPLAVRTNC